MLGDRIQYDGKFGTIRYIGPVDVSTVTWYGIEWDDPQRGKHDGTYKGKKYFTTIHNTGGSFVKPDGCAKSEAFFQAILDKYCISEEDMNEEIKFGSRSSTVEFKTKENTIRLRNLTNAFVFNKCIDRLGQTGLVLSNCPNIQDVDLSYNLLTHWSKVREIANELPNLTSLTLNGNRLLLDITHLDNTNSKGDYVNISSDNPFNRVKILCLKDMDLTWQHVCDIFINCGFQNCLELHLCDNQITNISNVEYFDNLQHIDFENNIIQNWYEILRLGKLNNLTTLQLNNCHITSIYFPSNSYLDANNVSLNGALKCSMTHEIIGPTCYSESSNLLNKVSMFCKLENLYLADNKLSEMSCVDEINKLQNLKSLRLSRNPIIKLYPNETSFRSDVIARTETINLLNGAKISSEERKGSEIDYLNTCMHQWLLFLESSKIQSKTGNPRDEFSVLYRRFFQLVTKYRINLKDEVLVKQKDTNIKSTLIQLRFAHIRGESLRGDWEKRLKDYVAKDTNETDIATTKIDKKIPSNIMVSRLKAIARKIFNDLNIYNLVRVVREDLVTGKNSGPGFVEKFGFVVLDIESESIDLYGVEEGDYILVC